MPDIEGRIEALGRRVAALEDEVAIQQVLARYGPAVDSGSATEAAGLWTEDGSYDAQIGAWAGREAIAGMVLGPGHQGLIHGGAAHVTGGMPFVTVDGDRATATVYYELHRREGGRTMLWRVTATRWELERLAGGWKVRRRVNRLLDGHEDGRRLLGAALDTRPA
jgi:SnoaL-like protein